MINAVLIDDERPSIRELEYFLKDYSEITVTATFVNPLEALDNIANLKPNVVFLDINMPQLGGIDAASKILDLSPKTDIIFVTAYDQYAIEAFELNALDYILKPINEARFRKTIDRVLKSKKSYRVQNAKKLKIRCFGNFLVGWENNEPVKWRAEKTKEIFAFLLLNQGCNVSKDELLDKLWPEDDPEKAIRQLYNGIYYIRKALENYGIDKTMINVNNSYSLMLGHVDYDVENFCKKAEDIKNLTIDELKQLDILYTDDYLRGDDFLWADFERERLSNLYCQCLLKLSDRYIEKKQWEDAEVILLKAYGRYPFEESITERLMTIYKLTQNKHKALKHFEIFSDLMKKELGVRPNSIIYNLYKSIF